MNGFYKTILFSLFFFIIIAVDLVSCNTQAPLLRIQPIAETENIVTKTDAADDAAIWYNQNNPDQSLILATDKTSGLYLYNLSGKVKQFLPLGRLNNVDLRQNIKLNDWQGDLIALSDRTHHSVLLLSLENQSASKFGSFSTGLKNPYGLCVGRFNGQFLVFVTYKSGTVQIWQISPSSTQLFKADLVKSLHLNSQTEGCVFDDETHSLYLSEENYGIWKYRFFNSETNAGFKLSPPFLIDRVNSASGLKADVEGLALYHQKNGGYLIVSSQGNNRFILYNRLGDNRFKTSFEIGQNPDTNIDGVEHTDGIAALSKSLGPDFPKGLLVVQDGENEKPHNQNFKLIGWHTIEHTLNLPDYSDPNPDHKSQAE